MISIALDEARLWLRRSKNLSKWREEPSLVVEQREIRRILQKATLDLPLIY